MNFVRLVFLPTVFSLLVSCGARSLYNSSHYGDTRLGDDLFRVTFRGGEHPMSGELCLLRCASFAGNQDTPTLRSWTRRPEVPRAILLWSSFPSSLFSGRSIFFRHSFRRQDDPVTQFSFGRWLFLRGSRNRGFAQKEVRNNRMNIYLSCCS